MRGLTAFCLVMLLLQTVLQTVLGSYLPRGNAETAVATVEFAASSVPIAVAPTNPADTQAAVRLLRGEVKVVESGETPGAFERLAKMATLVSNWVRGVCLYILFHLLWRLFQNLEQREIFSPRNLLFVRRLGVALVAYSFATLIVDLWKDWRIGQYLAEHYTFTGAKAFTHTPAGDLFSQFFGAYLRYADFDYSMFLIGLIVFVVAEVFRRGLALQEETDLTV